MNRCEPGRLLRDRQPLGQDIQVVRDAPPFIDGASMDLNKIYALASQGATPNKPYSIELPEQLAPWHVYFADAGHSILCVVGERWTKLLECSAVEEDVAELLASVSVKTLLRAGWDVHPRFGVIVARDIEYDSMYGVVTPRGDEEF